MTETDEGFLICQNVPIARTGYYEYLPREIGRDGDTPVRVFRSEEAVFSPAAMASFEGKPVTLGHPPVNVTPENGTAYICGHVQNVHRGRDEDSDLLLADLFITSAELIRRIKGGLREVSCGYECKYSDAEGEAEQHHIRGNHVAVVEAGRAGNRVAIKDEKGAPKARLGSEDSAQRSAATVPSEARSALTGEQKGGPQGRLGGEYSPQGYTAAVPGELRSNLTGDKKGAPEGATSGEQFEAQSAEICRRVPGELRSNLTGDKKPQPLKEGQKGKKTMPKNSLLAKFFSVTNHDADPEAIAEVAEKLAAPVMEAAVEAAAPAAEKPKDETPIAPAADPNAFDAEASFGELKGQFDALCKKLDELTAALVPAAPADPLDELEAELTEKAGEETPADADPDESVTIPAESMDEEGEEEKPAASADSAVRAAISVIKPIIAKLPASERRSAADAAARQLRTMRGMQDKKAAASGGAYAAISNARAKAAAKDAKPAQPEDAGELGRAIMARRNPHYQAKA